LAFTLPDPRPHRLVVFFYGVRDRFPAEKALEVGRRFPSALSSTPGLSVTPINMIQRPPFDADNSSCIEHQPE